MNLKIITETIHDFREGLTNRLEIQVVAGDSSAKRGRKKSAIDLVKPIRGAYFDT